MVAEVIKLNMEEPSLIFSDSDKRFLQQMAESFEAMGLPHTLTYGFTEEGQEWCLVHKLVRSNDQCAYFTETISENYEQGICHAVPVADITVISYGRDRQRGYRHSGTWGYRRDDSLRNLFKHLIPSAYRDAINNYWGVIVFDEVAQ